MSSHQEQQSHGHGHGHHTCSSDIEVLVHNLKWKKNEVVLDYGCGDGQNVMKNVYPTILQNNSQLFGVDFAAGSIDKAKENYPGHADHFFAGDILSEGWPLKDQKFDKITAVHSLNYMVNLKDFFLKIHPQLNDGGQIGASVILTPLGRIFNEMCKTPKYGGEFKEAFPVFPTWAESKESIEWIRGVILESGFAIEFIETLDTSHTFKNLEDCVEMYSKMMLKMSGLDTKMTEEAKSELKQFLGKEICGLLKVPLEVSPLVFPRTSLRFVVNKI